MSSVMNKTKRIDRVLPRELGMIHECFRKKNVDYSRVHEVDFDYARQREYIAVFVRSSKYSKKKVRGSQHGDFSRMYAHYTSSWDVSA